MSDKENFDSDTELSVGKRSNVSSASETISHIARSLIDKTIKAALGNIDLDFERDVIIASSKLVDEIIKDAKEIVVEDDDTISVTSSIASSRGTPTLKNNKNRRDYDYSTSEREAFELVNRALNSAVNRFEKDVSEKLENAPSSGGRGQPEQRKIFLEDKDKCGELVVANVDWPTIGEFTEESCTEKIEEFVSTWIISEEWLHCIDYLLCETTEFDNRHQYRVRFSVPTPKCPIPYATVCVYFTVAVSNIKPKDSKVDVFYIVESTRLVHKPGEYKFCQLWLERIIASKTRLLKIIDF